MQVQTNTNKLNQHHDKTREDTKINKTAESIPDKEMHGLWLAASNKIKAIQHIEETKIPIEAAHIGIDALSQVIR